MALSHLGSSKEIANISTENSSEANVMRRFFDNARKEVFEDYDWPFSIRHHIALTQLEEDPNDAWGYSYAWPSDTLKISEIWSGIRKETRQSQVNFEIAFTGSAKIIYTDEKDALCNVISDVTETELYPASFSQALAMKLAVYGAPRLTGGDPFKLQEKMIQLYTFQISRAAANAYNEQGSHEEVASELERERNADT